MAENESDFNTLFDYIVRYDYSILHLEEKIVLQKGNE